MKPVNETLWKAMIELEAQSGSTIVRKTEFIKPSASIIVSTIKKISSKKRVTPNQERKLSYKKER